MTIDEIKTQLAALTVALAQAGFTHAAERCMDAATFIEAKQDRDEAEAPKE